LSNKIAEIESGSYIATPKQTLGQYMKEWLEDKKDTIREDTYSSYSWLVHRHIIPKLGHIELAKLTPQHVQTFYRNLRQGDKPISNRSVQYVHRILRQALNRAVKWGLLPRNVTDAVNVPRVSRKELNVWNADQVNDFLKTARSTVAYRYWITFFLAFMTGMRLGEILALRWKDLDLASHHPVAHVNGTLKWIEGKPLITAPKTEKSRRSVALSPDTVRELLDYRDFQENERRQQGAEYHDLDLVIPRPKGFYMHPKSVEDAWERAVKKSGLPRIRFHDTRHTHATLLLTQGVHPKVVSERLGHSTISITMDTYSHVMPGLQHDAAVQFDKLLHLDEGHPSGR
jgi:integrase